MGVHGAKDYKEKFGENQTMEKITLIGAARGRKFPLGNSEQKLQVSSCSRKVIG